ncbi:MAG: hypothetical protein AAFY29_10830 [Pseudomonadota bacterium]
MRALVFAIALWLGNPVQAHLLPAQHATLRFADGRVYMVLAVSPSALAGNLISGTAMTSDQFAARYDELAQRATQGLTLDSAAGSATLLDLRLAPTLAHDTHAGEIDQITVLAVFDLTSGSDLVFATELFGTEPGEDRYEIICSDSDGRRRQSYLLTREAPRVELQSFALTL